VKRKDDKNVIFLCGVEILTAARWNPFDANPPEREHCRVVINVEE
jgi:hypothetical protein